MKEMIKQWKAEEEIAHVHGWDFSHIDGRCVEETPPWDYRQVIGEYRKPEMKLLDIDTGGLGSTICAVPAGGGDLS